MADQVKPSRMELRLEAEIASARTSLAADCKRAERAAYLSRLGRLAESRDELTQLRAVYGTRPNAMVSSWLHLVEGLISHFGDMDPAARAKILRAHALSSAANLKQLQALCAAWLAHMDYLQGNVASMGKHVKESLSLAAPNEHGTRSRVCLVVAQAFHLADRTDFALPWYDSSRSHAVAEGDEATVSALMHNMAWLRAQQIRVRGWKQPSLASLDPDYALLGAESTANFDQLIGSKSWPALVPVLRAQILAARGEYAEALGLLQSNLQAAVRDGLGRLRADLLADKAWCHANLGDMDQARVDAIAAQASIDQTGQFDDRAMAHSRLVQVFEALGERLAAQLHQGLAFQAWSGHSSLQAQFLNVLRDVRVSQAH